MTKKLLPFIFFIFCFKYSWSQQTAGDKMIKNHYSAVNKIPVSDSVNYYVVKTSKQPFVAAAKARVVKRLSYNYYIVASNKPILQSADFEIVAPANALWKASDNLALVTQKHPNSSRIIAVDITLNNNTALSQLAKYAEITTANGNRITANIRVNKLQELLQQPYVVFADKTRKAHAELAISDIDLGANTISTIQSNYPGINGQGINVSVKEDKYDNDLDLLGRTFDSFPTSAITSGHATTMATLIGGNGNSFIKGLGAAPKVRFTSADFINLFPDSTAVFKMFDIGLQNHSYGTGIENYYGAETVAYDEQVWANDSIVHVFSSGNIGLTAPAVGVYNGLTGVANLSGDFKQAKNVLVIGGTGRTNIPEDLSSGGPAYDGRIKPELVADGEDGTSGAAALASGTVALLQQAYKLKRASLPPAALIKAILINSADDIGNAYVDFKTGYGKLNALEAMRTMQDNRFNSGTVGSGGQSDFSINVPASTKELKVSIAWADPAAALNAPNALVNDLDLSVAGPDGKAILPWTLNSFPSLDSLHKLAQRQTDTINNTEQVTIANPIAGIYTIHVKGRKVPQGPQTFYMAYQAVQANKFEWIYPVAGSQLFASDDNYLRWQSSFDTATGRLSISYDHGVTWKAIDNVTLKNNYDDWQAPDVFSTAMLKMDIGSNSFLSAEFNISAPIALSVGYNCTQGTLLHWPAQQGSTGYVVYTIKDNVLQKLSTVTDTSVIIPAGQQTSRYFAVSAAGNGFEGLKSYTIDVTTQGVGCYVKTLLATVTGNKVLLDLSLGSTVNLKSITWEKMTGPAAFTSIGDSPVITNQLGYQFTDAAPKQVQYYRAKLITADNQVIYTDAVKAVVLQNKQFAVYPNPVDKQFTILSGDINNYDLKLYDASGKLSLTQTLNNLQNIVAVNLNPGIYVYAISLSGHVVYSGKLIKL
ncbi:S8 family peptidase [Mucilaginibacter dorajii]|uniref:Peptidase S8/S53 domain-containing protein n=1 Tax=Mucilaginibacter dorajii TaxID=692994 RepID=A0ABP7Q7L0_9SPHI|nr:S8 family peptidase [Mucilaginibacter dorajii]MCS3737554.1 hypothetical protein [Mucilaginibacter dorajii]